MGEISTASIDSLRVPSLKKPVGSVRGLWHGPTTGIPHKSHQETLAIYGYPSQIACQRPINQSIISPRYFPSLVVQNLPNLLSISIFVAEFCPFL